MDLGTVLSRINGEQYENVEEFLDDTQLIWDNCKTYNLKGSVNVEIYSGFINLLISQKRTVRKC